jgi:O-antigen ligase
MSVLSTTILAGQTAWGYERLTGQTSQQSAESRATANIASLNMLAAKPFFGWGFGNYDREKQPFMERVGGIRVYNATSHNTYLSVLAELGSVGFFLYYFPTLWWLMVSIKVWRQLPKGNLWNRRLLLMLWLVMLHMFIVTNFMDMIRYFPFGNAMWWLTLSLIANMICTHLNAVEAQSTKRLQIRNKPNYSYQSMHI